MSVSPPPSVAALIEHRVRVVALFVTRVSPTERAWEPIHLRSCEKAPAPVFANLNVGS